MKAHLKCNVPACGHIHEFQNPVDIRQCMTDVRLMINHYKWDHADLIGEKKHVPGAAFGDYYDYRPYYTWPGPTCEWTGDDGSTGNETWEELIKYYLK